MGEPGEIHGAVFVDVPLSAAPEGARSLTCQILRAATPTRGTVLVVPGVGGSRRRYAPLIDRLVGAGWDTVVALTGAAHPDALLASTNPVSAILADSSVVELGALRAVVGHSLGAHLVLSALARLPSDIAIVLVSPGRSPAADRAPLASGSRALLVVQAYDDRLAAYEGGRQLYADTLPPKAMVSLVGGDHGCGVTVDSTHAAQRSVTGAVIAFLGSVEQGHWTALEEACRAIATAGVGELRMEVTDPAIPTGPVETTLIDLSDPAPLVQSATAVGSAGAVEK